jgi:glycosyltransferase involved in cell wall biosynthesis
MKKVIDIGFGRKTLYELYKSTQMSSRLQYGLAQLEEKYQIEHISWEPFTVMGLIRNNLMVLRQCDVVFLTYLYMQPVLLLALLRRCGFFRKRKFIAISHVPLRGGRNSIETVLLSIAYKSFNKILFHSQKNMEESVNAGLIERKRCDVLLWGDDLDYIDKQIKVSQGLTFLSTGREHRDYFILISAFAKRPNIQLEIYTNLYNYDSSNESLICEQGKYINIHIEFVEKSTETTRLLAQKVGECLCVVIPVEKDGLYYCVGFTSVVEAMAMSKPIISTRNTYYPIDLEKEGIGLYVDDIDSWVNAIEYLYSHPEIAEKMGKKARKLAEKRYNIVECSKQINRLFCE